MSADDVDKYIRQVLDDSPRFRQVKRKHRYQIPDAEKRAITLEHRRAAQIARSQTQLVIVRVADGWRIESRRGKIRRRSPEVWTKRDQAQKALDAGYQMQSSPAPAEFPQIRSWNHPRGEYPCILCQLVGETTDARYCVRICTSETEWFFAQVCQRSYHYQVELNRLIQYRSDGNYDAVEQDLIKYHREYRLKNDNTRGHR